MLKEFKEFLLKTNALALAIGVIIGGSVGKVVSSLVADILMPIISMGIPGGSWRESKVVLGSSVDAAGKSVENAMTLGAFLGSVVDFIIIAAAVFLITKMLLKPEPAAPAPPSKTCPECLDTIPVAARKCRSCGSAVPA